jgi:hypothetical protein
MMGHIRSTDFHYFYFLLIAKGHCDKVIAPPGSGNKIKRQLFTFLLLFLSSTFS